MEQEELTNENIEQKLQDDIEYINTEIIAKQIDGNYCKWSRALNAIAVIGLTKKQFLDYWQKQYKYYPEYLDKLMEVCVNKLENGLTSREEFIQLILNSKDVDSEKAKAILGGRYVY